MKPQVGHLQCRAVGARESGWVACRCGWVGARESVTAPIVHAVPVVGGSVRPGVCDCPDSSSCCASRDDSGQ